VWHSEHGLINSHTIGVEQLKSKRNGTKETVT
jgi:hypothetical protein